MKQVVALLFIFLVFDGTFTAASKVEPKLGSSTKRKTSEPTVELGDSKKKASKEMLVPNRDKTSEDTEKDKKPELQHPITLWNVDETTRFGSELKKKEVDKNLDRPTKAEACTNGFSKTKAGIRSVVGFLGKATFGGRIGSDIVPEIVYFIVVFGLCIVIAVIIASAWGVTYIALNDVTTENTVQADWFRLLGLFASIFLFWLSQAYDWLSTMSPQCNFVDGSAISLPKAMKTFDYFQKDRPLPELLAEGAEFVNRIESVTSVSRRFGTRLIKRFAKKDIRQTKTAYDQAKDIVDRGYNAKDASVSISVDDCAAFKEGDDYLSYIEWVFVAEGEEKRDPLRLLATFFHPQAERRPTQNLDPAIFLTKTKRNDLLCKIYLERILLAEVDRVIAEDLKAGTFRASAFTKPLSMLKEDLLKPEIESLYHCLVNYRLDKHDAKTNAQDPVKAMLTDAKGWSGFLMATALLIPAMGTFASYEWKCPALVNPKTGALEVVTAYNASNNKQIETYPAIGYARTWECLLRACHLVCQAGFEPVNGYHTCKKMGAKSIYWTHLLTNKWTTPACCIASSDAPILHDISVQASGNSVRVRTIEAHTYSATCGLKQTIHVQECITTDVTDDWAVPSYCDAVCTHGPRYNATKCPEYQSTFFTKRQEAKWNHDPVNLQPKDSVLSVPTGTELVTFTPSTQGQATYRILYTSSRQTVYGPWVDAA
jgi:hypothetical protein